MKTNDKYILGGEDGHTPVPVDDLLEWARWFETADRVVKQEKIGPYFVSTVFLGLAHGMPLGKFFEEIQSDAIDVQQLIDRPYLFETMAFVESGSPARKVLAVQERCSTWDEAVAQHERVAGEFRKAANG